MDGNSFNEVLSYINTDNVCHLCLKQCENEALMPICVEENIKLDPDDSNLKCLQMNVADFIFFITNQHEVKELNLIEIKIFS